MNNLLIIDDNISYLELLNSAFKKNESNFNIFNSSSLNDALTSISNAKIDIILLDLFLPDSAGINTLLTIRNTAPDIPVIVITGEEERSNALEAVQLGAQDYLIKSDNMLNNLVRTVEYALERHKVQQNLKDLVFIDELTGLYNFRGFKHSAESYMKLAIRKNERFLICFIDLDNLKSINDKYGHLVGSEAIINSAKIIKKTFRETDLYARFGGDEFVVLIIDNSLDSVPIIDKRFIEYINKFNEESDNEYTLSLSWGYSEFDPVNPFSLDELLNIADKNMYENKSLKKVN
ncbi:MAG: diguanylate cyclase [Candidatus Dadabacteria bacterium]|nr:diguanylate cyclase [Candidatus Dadabacteria bacterium]NIQ13362.1 diguanylate cyclase [Candidatus Dadabacteria bacterium]